LDMPT